MTELTEAETDLLGPFIWGGWIGVAEGKREAFSHELRATVERIIDARLAPIRALADEWQHLALPGMTSWDYGDDLRAALSAPLTAPDVTDDPQGHQDADEAHNDDYWRCACGEKH